MNKLRKIKNQIAQGSGSLKSVFQIRFKSKITGADLLDCNDLEILEIRFLDWSVFLLAVGEDDTIKFLTEIPKSLGEYTQTELSLLVPWAGAIGFELFTFWLMENHRGYTDAVQFEFGEPGNNLRHRIQLEVAGSLFKTYSVNIENDIE